jgi:hypothetical protein
MIINPKIQALCDFDSTWNPSMSLITEGKVKAQELTHRREGIISANCERRGV